MAIRRSLGISGATQAINFILNFGSVIVVSRLLTPEEIGIFSVAVSLIGIAHILRDFGVGQYLIQAKDVSRERMRAAFSVMLFISWTIAALLFLLRWPIADFYQRDSVAEVIGVISFNFLIIPFGAPILSVMRREMLFGKLALVSTTNTAVQAAVTVLTALNGFGYMSMAWGSIAGMLTNIALLFLLRPAHVMLLPTFKGLREVLSFGYKASAATLVNEAGASAPDIIIGRTLDFAAVAFYSRAAGLINMIMAQIIRVIQDVFLPAFAKDFRGGGDPSRMYAQAMGHMTGVTVPLIAFIALMSEPLILFFFGDQWARSAPLASVLCIYSLLTAPFSLAANALIATGYVGSLLKVQITSQSLRILILLCSIWVSLENVVLLLSIWAIATSFLFARCLKHSFNLEASALFKSIWRSYLLIPLTLALPITFRAFNNYNQWDLSDLSILLLSGILFSVTWLASIFLVRHPLNFEIMQILRTIRPRKA
ncbi:hypothetical protein CEW83_18840 [Parazoarcus communis]|uniref:Lipopolysaccharide biosynthesis protein n=1 Tax=Parazoarcus communis TaxID=41977 RepID=A0A2U8GUC8_9RHOO|nr:lipopolysaccharide biosynthesis protein [Parazoarcus communis]AWI77034.1 hypothetical protein CEW83_18840 [Parazoarcus communis]